MSAILASEQQYLLFFKFDMVRFSNANNNYLDWNCCEHFQQLSMTVVHMHSHIGRCNLFWFLVICGGQLAAWVPLRDKITYQHNIASSTFSQHTVWEKWANQTFDYILPPTNQPKLWTHQPHSGSPSGRTQVKLR